MAKKSFKENPALSFISQALQAEEPIQEEKAEKENEKKYTYIHTDAEVYTDEKTKKIKKAPESMPAALPITLQKRGESKSKRLQLLIRPSVHERLLRIAQEYGTSVNDVINQVLEGFVGESVE